VNIEDEESHYRSTSVRHEALDRGDLVREVRWFSRSSNAYRWSKSGDRWVYLGKVGNLDLAKNLAAKDMYQTHRRR
jgi:hypothetical protein